MGKLKDSNDYPTIIYWNDRNLSHTHNNPVGKEVEAIFFSAL